MIKPVILKPWMEYVGTLTKVDENVFRTLLHFEKGDIISLPIETGKDLKKMVGERISILRSDSPRKPYLWMKEK